MNQQQLAEIREEIVAYLDGELAPQEVAAIEQRLAKDEQYRNEMLLLQRTWDMLGQLPQLTAPTDFTKTTLEMAAINAEESKPKRRPSTGAWKWLVASLIVSVSGWTGFVIANGNAKNPNRLLARDLELLQQFKLYEEVYSIELLEKLDEEGLFLSPQQVKFESGVEEVDNAEID